MDMQASPLSAMAQPRIVGRYAVYGEIAAGGMATVHFGRLVGAVGFARTVAVKRLHPQFAKDPDFVGMFLDEARLAARIQHPNVVVTLDVVPLDDEVFLIMEYVHGEALSKLIRAARRRGELVPPRIAVSTLAGALHGLHAAHEAKSERGHPLGIVHRDVSPQNILIGTDGVPRVLDFGVAKAVSRTTSTRDGQMKGKVSYMSPEQLRGKGVDRRTDVFAAGIVLWEALTGRRLFDGDDPGEVLTKLLEAQIPVPSHVEPSVPRVLDDIVMRALIRDPNGRWSTAREFAIALEHSGCHALPREVGEWVEIVGGETISKRAVQVAEIESMSSSGLKPVGELPTAVGPMSRMGSHPSYPEHSPQPYSAPPSSWRVNAQGEPITSPSQVSHVTGVSRPSAPSATSQPSQLSTSQGWPPQPQQQSSRGLHAALIGIAAALGLALVAMVVVLVGRQRLRAQAEAATSATTAVTQTTVTAPSATLPPPEPPKPPDTAATAPEPVDPAPPPPPPPRATGSKVQTKKSQTTSKSTSASDSNCDPPYFIDKNGFRRVKPGCM